MQLPRQLNHYRLEVRLGRGGMGEVYQAHDLRLGREVAIKMLPLEVAKDPVRRKRFERESRALAALNHPNIVTVYAIEDGEAGDPFMVMELIDGHTLRRQMPVAGMPLGRAVELLLPVVHAVAAAHRAHIVHRDLKPENVMVRNDGVIKVVDFGISKREIEQETVVGGVGVAASETITQEGVIMGTLHYTPPEYLEGRGMGPPGDVFSLGVVLYEMVAGEKPFVGHRPMSVVGSILRENPRQLEPDASKLPRPLVDVLDKCLAKDPARRYADAGELAAALAELQAQVAAETAAIERRPQRVRRRRIAVGASLLVLGLGGVLLAWWWTQRAGSQAAEPAAIASAAAPAAA